MRKSTGYEGPHPAKNIFRDPLPVVGFTVEACKLCNQDTSIDEEYLACFIECVISGSANPDKIGRSKIRAALEHSNPLRTRISESFRDSIWYAEIDRVNNVISKLARGHVAFEYSECGLDSPSSIEVAPYEFLSNEQMQNFENAGAGDLALWPEIGSRGFLRAVGMHLFQNSPGPWITVQEGRYRYSVNMEPQLVVRIVISEYLACLVQW